MKRPRPSTFAALCAITLITVLAAFAPVLSPNKFNEPLDGLANMPPRIKMLEKLGIFDGSRVLKNRRVESLSDTDIYPPGSVLKVYPSRFTNGAEMADIRVSAYIMEGAGDRYFAFGTDYLGRDMWTRVWRGARTSLLAALVSAALNTLFGVIIGVICGFYGGATDLFLMRLTEIADSLPQIAVFTLLIVFMGPGLIPIITALCVKGWTGFARITRAQFLRHKSAEFVLASRIMGAKNRRVIFRHIMPSAAGPVITRGIQAIPSAIFAESFLAYIGLGIQAPETTLGLLMSDGRLHMLDMPYMVFIPAAIVSALMISFNILSVNIRESLDPRLYDGKSKA